VFDFEERLGLLFKFIYLVGTTNGFDHSLLVVHFNEGPVVFELIFFLRLLFLDVPEIFVVAPQGI
jgi:hypothetical protein